MLRNGQELPLLNAPAPNNEGRLLYLNTKPPKGYRFKEKFFTGVAYDHARMVAEDDGEHLLSLDFGDSVDVFYEDGRVVRYMHNGKVEKVPLSAEMQAQLRCSQALFRFRKASALRRDVRAKAEDGALHEIAAVLRVGGACSEAALQVAYDALASVADEHALRPNVYYHVTDALRRVSTMHLHLFKNDYRAGEKPTPQDRATPTQTPRANNLTDRRRKMEARVKNDRETRAAMRGGTSGGKKERGGKKKR